MKITEEKSEKLKREYDIVVEADKVESATRKKLEDIGKQVKVPGFRAGKVPAAVVKARFGKEAMAEVLDDLLNQAIKDLYADKKLTPAMRPEVDVKVFDDGKDLEFKVKMEILPSVPEVDFSKIKVKKVYTEVTDEAVEKSLKNLAESRKKPVKIAEDRELKKGDVALIDFEGFTDGKAFVGGKGRDYSLELGSGSFIPGFEDQLIGKKPGEDVTVKVSFPKEYAAKDLAGKDAEFKVKIKEIQKFDVPAADDELAKKFGRKDLSELRDMIKTEMSREYDAITKNHLKRGLLDILADSYKFDVPECLVKAEFESIWASAQKESLAKKEILTDKDKKDYENIAERRIRLGLIITEVGKKEKIQPETADIKDALIAEARNYPGHEKDVFNLYQKNQRFRDSVSAAIFEGKVVEHILSKITLEPEKVSVEKLYSWYDDIDAEREKADTEEAKAKKNR